MDVRQLILAELRATVEEFTPIPFPDPVDDDMLLDAFHLDSGAFTTLLVGLEAQMGFIPSGILQGVAFPETVGDLIQAYEDESV